MSYTRTRNTADGVESETFNLGDKVGKMVKSYGPGRAPVSGEIVGFHEKSGQPIVKWGGESKPLLVNSKMLRENFFMWAPFEARCQAARKRTT